MWSLHKPKRFKLRAFHGAFLGHFGFFLRLIYLQFTFCRVAWNTSVVARVLGGFGQKIHILLDSLRATNRIHKDKSKSRHNYHQISLLLRAAFELNHFACISYRIYSNLFFGICKSSRCDFSFFLSTSSLIFANIFFSLVFKSCSLLDLIKVGIPLEMCGGLGEGLQLGLRVAVAVGL